MKLIGTLLLVLFSTIGVLGAQNVRINYESRKIDFPEPGKTLCFSHGSSSGYFLDNLPNSFGGIAPLVMHIPVCYTAFFCKMEVVTQKSLGIIIKVHAGDYDSYMDLKIPR